jgi:hypothetical protein
MLVLAIAAFLSQVHVVRGRRNQPEPARSDSLAA